MARWLPGHPGLGLRAGSRRPCVLRDALAARAALSEEDRYAKTHAGTWHLFHELFVVPARFDETLFERAQRTLPLRLAADYEARRVPHHEAEEVVELAGRFLEAIEALYPD